MKIFVVPFSLKLVPIDFDCFRPLNNYFRCLTFYTGPELKTSLESFFETEPGTFWQDGIHHLVERRERIVKLTFETDIRQ